MIPIFDPDTAIGYNYYEPMREEKSELYELLAEARAIHFAMRCKAISYEEAKRRVESILTKLNIAGERIAKKYGRKHRKITFENLGTNF